MAWPKTPTAEELLGMKPEDLKSKLDSAASKDDVKAAVDAANAETKSQLEQIQNSLKALTTPRTEPPAKTEPDDPTVSILTDPTKFVSDATKDVREASLRTQAQIQEMRARQDSRFSNLFAKYGKELTEAASRFSIAQQAQDNFWEFHVRAFLGDKMVKGELREGNFPSLIGTSSVGPRTDGSSSDPDHGLNPEVAAFLRGRGVPSDKAARIQQLMHVDGEPITHANYFKKAS
jgi:hypothetical protein